MVQAGSGRVEKGGLNLAILNFKRFLNFYGSHPENFTDEIKEWISSTPPDKLRRDLQNYRAEVGVAFYNINLGNALEPIDGGYAVNNEELEKLGNPLKDFYLKYIGGPIRLINKDGTEEKRSYSVESSQIINIMMYAPQPVYRAIVDKAIAGETMTEDEIKHINQALAGGWVDQQYSEEKQRYRLRRIVYFWFFGIIRALYEFVYDISCQRVEIQRCAAEDCNNIFVPYKPGKEQQFCSERCYKRVYMRDRRRKDKMVSVEI